MVVHGEPVQAEHAENGAERGEQHPQLERDRDHGGPGEVRLAADHQGVGAGVDPPLQDEPERGSRESHAEDDPGKLGAPEPHGFVEAMDWEGGMGVPSGEPRVAHLFARLVEVRRRREFGQDSIAGPLRKPGHEERHQEAPSGASSPPPFSLPRWAPTSCSWLDGPCGLACGRTVLTSDVATIGTKRTNRQNIVKNSPKLPSRHDTSQIVGVKCPQDEGRKSRCSDVVMITNRSNHMPMLMMIDMVNRIGMLVRAFLDQNTWGLITLQETMIQ